ncbi:TetR/AcrR family transcriptional regulator [Dietzia psychralcaliphila]|uniref:TetR/AcrR family transcriptional regulator n=1 Tax=Dietzia psychralcaliphila TaxID=139021 RepID=UPI001C1DDA1D|nr:TetR/AcrR family transcriptional regulator [Dietzia psychralcaliphila]
MTSSPALPTWFPDAPPPGSRRAEIALVAAEEFTRRGYHATRVEHIADRLAVTPGALYRYVPGKYAMFRDAVATLVAELDAATSGSDDLDHLVASATRATLTHRSRAALYRWQIRYLTPEDRAAVVAADIRIRQRFSDAIRGDGSPSISGSGTAAGAGSGARAGAGAGSDSGARAGTRGAAGAILASIASLGHHRIEVTDAGAVALMRSIAADLAACTPGVRSIPPPQAENPSSPGSTASDSTAPGSTAPGSTAPGSSAPGSTAPGRLRGGAATREGAITAAIARFHSSGYDEVTMEAIGADVGVAASALYRHFPGKSALLTAAVDRTATLVSELLDRHAALHGSEDDPAEALVDLLDQYVSISFSHGPELMLYHSELGTLGPDDRRRIRRSQLRQLERWAGLVRAASPAGTAVDDATARIRVHAALAVVLDGGQGSAFHPSAAARFGDLARTVLLPPDRLTALPGRSS